MWTTDMTTIYEATFVKCVTNHIGFRFGAGDSLLLSNIVPHTREIRDHHRKTCYLRKPSELGKLCLGPLDST